MDEPLIDALRDLLMRWECGAIDRSEVHHTAERWYESTSWPQYPEADRCSIAVEVLSNLEALNHQLIGRCDIPAMLAFLGATAGDEVASWHRWKAYWDAVDFGERERKRGDGMYFPG